MTVHFVRNPTLCKNEVTLEWIQTLPLVTDLSATDKGSCDVASDENIDVRKCGPCEDVGAVATGEMYCLECQTHLCGVCVDVHKKFKALANHKLLDGSEVTECEDILSDLHRYRKCPSHPDRDVEIFCKDDEVFLCLLCASTSHKNCRNDIEASQCTQSTEKRMDELKTRVEKTQKHLTMLQQLARQNGSFVKTETESAEQDVTDIRNKIVGHLDTIIETVFRSTKQIRQGAEVKSNATKERLERMSALFDNKLLYLSTISKYGNTPEVFLGSDHLKSEIEKLEEEVLTIDKTFETTDVDLAIVDELNKLSEKIDPSTMPSISAKDKASDHQPKYSLPHDVGAEFKVGDAEQHSVRFNGVCLPTFSGISIKEDGRLILCDSCSYKSPCGNLCLYCPDTKMKTALSTKHPYNATLLENKTIAFTWKSKKTISVLTVGSELKVEKSLDTRFTPRSIHSLGDGKVAISWDVPPGFGIADISGPAILESQYLTQDSDGRTFKSFDHMAVDEPRKLVIQPCYKDKAVYCFDFTGKPVFKYTNGLKNPQSVAVDSRGGTVYVCDRDDACIHQLALRGQPITVIRHTDLKNPLDVCYDRRRKCLWVSNESSYDDILCLKRA